MITGNRDTDLIVLAKLSNVELFIFTKFRNIYISKFCKYESLWRERLFKYYVEIYPEIEQTWKDLYLSLVYRLDKHKYQKDDDSFIYASEKGHLSVVKYLIILSKEYNNYAIECAKGFGHLSVVNYLLSLPEEYGVRL